MRACACARATDAHEKSQSIATGQAIRASEDGLLEYPTYADPSDLQDALTPCTCWVVIDCGATAEPYLIDSHRPLL